jgi:hypothetical protein
MASPVVISRAATTSISLNIPSAIVGIGGIFKKGPLLCFEKLPV